MQKVGAVVKEITSHRTSRYDVDELFKDALKDKRVKEFVKNNQIDDKTLQTYRSELIQFTSRSDAGEQLELAFIKSYKHNIIEIREFPPEPVKRRKKLRFDELNKVLLGLRFENLVVDESNTKLVKSLKNLVSEFGTSGHDKGIWVHGKFGRGKTYILGALANELHAVGAGVTLMSLKSFVDTYMAKDFKDKEHYFQSVAQAEVLILDDVGTESLSEYAVKLIYDLMATRYAHKRLTFASSNLTILEYQTLLNRSNAVDADRLIERLRHMFVQYRLDGHNRRG